MARPEPRLEMDLNNLWHPRMLVASCPTTILSTNFSKRGIFAVIPMQGAQDQFLEEWSHYQLFQGSIPIPSCNEALPMLWTQPVKAPLLDSHKEQVLVQLQWLLPCIKTAETTNYCANCPYSLWWSALFWLLKLTLAPQLPSAAIYFYEEFVLFSDFILL